MFPESNTWGAYQAYGDPDFCLGQKSSVRKAGSEDVTVAAEEVLIDLDGLSLQIGTSDPSALRKALSKIEETCSSDWLKQGTFQERLGGAYSEHGLFKEAIERYQRAAETEDPSNPATLRAIEQWINLTVRLGEKEGNKVMIEEALEKGRHLLGIAKTSERLNIMGSAHKKLAQLETDAERVKAHLGQSAAYYREAVSRQQQQHEGVADPYPIINLMVVEALLGGKERLGSESLLSKCESLAQQRFHATRSVWDAFAIPDIALIRAFLDHSLPQEKDNLVEKYRSAFTESSATHRQQDSALTQMKFVRDILSKLSYSDQETVASTIKSLDYIQNQLQQRDQTTEPPASEAKQKDQRPRSPKASAKQPVQKNPVREEKPRRPKPRGKR
jgi:tetratricopeptide (TPR) repeat protein